jgi:glycosyltransferase involved in cell wall biosynthesis
MRVAIVAPLDRESGIADYAREQARAFSAHGVPVFITPSGSSTDGGFASLPPHAYRPDQYDLTIVHLGNEQMYRYALDLIHDQTLVVVHDRILHGMFGSRLSPRLSALRNAQLALYGMVHAFFLCLGVILVPFRKTAPAVVLASRCLHARRVFETFFRNALSRGHDLRVVRSGRLIMHHAIRGSRRLRSSVLFHPLPTIRQNVQASKASSVPLYSDRIYEQPDGSFWCSGRIIVGIGRERTLRMFFPRKTRLTIRTPNEHEIRIVSGHQDIRLSGQEMVRLETQPMGRTTSIAVDLLRYRDRRRLAFRIDTRIAPSSFSDAWHEPLEPSEQIIITFGAVQAHKRLHALCRAFDSAAVPGAKLVIVGAICPEYHEIEPYLARSDILFTAGNGFVDSAIVDSLYARASAFVSLRGPSTGGTSGPLLRAIAHGLPILCSETPENELFISAGATGIPIDSRESEVLESAIRSVLRGQLTATIPKDVSSQWAWHRMVDQLLRIGTTQPRTTPTM